MNDETSLIKLIREIVPEQNDVIIGRVVSENPLIVQGKNDIKLTLNSNTLILSKQFRTEPLKLGEEIHILVFNDRKGYYALDRR